MAEPIKLSDYKDTAPPQKVIRLSDYKDAPSLFTAPTGYKEGESPTLSRDEVKSQVGEVAPYVGRLAGNSLPMLGGMFGGIPGAGLGSVGKVELQNEFPSIFGERPQDLGNFAKTLGVDLAAQGILPQILGKIAGGFTTGNAKARLLAGPGSSFPAVREGAAREMTNQIMSHYVAKPESTIIEKGASEAKGSLDKLIGDYKSAQSQFPSTLLEDSIISPGTKISKQVPYGTPGSTPHPAVSAAGEKIRDAFGKNSVGKALVTFQKELNAGADVAKSQTYKSIANTTLSDLINVRNAQLVTNPEFTANLAYNKLLTNGFKEVEGKLNATQILNELGGANKQIYEEAAGSSLGDFKDFLGELAKQQKSGLMDKVLGYSKGRLFLTGALTVAGGHFYGPVGAAAAMAPLITNAMLSKAMANPQTAKLVVAAMRTPQGTPQAAMLTKVFTDLFHLGSGVATTPEQ